MKKVCAFLMFILSVYGMFPAYATTDIGADAESSECVENITGTYSGDANFKAKWRSNVIQLNWYNNHTLMQGVNTESNTCNYGATLTTPTTPPERIGYIFDGWKVRPKMDFSTLTSLPNGTQRWGKGYIASNGADYCLYDNYTHVDCKTTEGFASLNQKEWKVQFNSGTTKGTLYGSAWCSARSCSGVNHYNWTTASPFATTAQLEEATGIKHHCWCQATGWQPENSSTVYANSNNISWGNVSVLSSDAWVYFRSDRATENYCNQICAYDCAYRAFNNSYFRRALFVGDGN